MHFLSFSASWIVHKLLNSASLKGHLNWLVTLDFCLVLFWFVKVKGCCISIERIHRIWIRQKLRKKWLKDIWQICRNEDFSRWNDILSMNRRPFSCTIVYSMHTCCTMILLAITHEYKGVVIYYQILYKAGQEYLKGMVMICTYHRELSMPD